MTEATELDRLKQAAMDAAEIARAAHEAYETARIAANRVRVGDILRARDGAEAKVIAVYVQYGRVQHTAVLRKEDGSWGHRAVPWGDWEDSQVVGHE